MGQRNSSIRVSFRPTATVQLAQQMEQHRAAGLLERAIAAIAAGADGTDA
jgi:hypothetical protein